MQLKLSHHILLQGFLSIQTLTFPEGFRMTTILTHHGNRSSIWDINPRDSIRFNFFLYFFHIEIETFLAVHDAVHKA